MSKKEYDPVVAGAINFCTEFAEILGENFLVEDMIWQEDLFKIQDKLAKLICNAANSHSAYTRRFVQPFIDKNPVAFKQEKV